MSCPTQGDCPLQGWGGACTPEPCAAPQSLPRGAVEPRAGSSHPFSGGSQSRAVRGPRAGEAGTGRAGCAQGDAVGVEFSPFL